jgi:hypothetical protein
MTDPTQIVDRSEPATADLAVIARRIEAEHKAALRSAERSLEHAHRVGCLLIEAKREVDAAGGHRWLRWLEEHVTFDRRRAAEYIRVATNWIQIQEQMSNRRTFGLKTALHHLAEPWETPAGDEDMTSAGARALIAEARRAVWEAATAEERLAMTEEAEEQLDEEREQEKVQATADREAKLLNYCVRAVARLRKRLTKLGARGRPVLKALARLERLVEGLEAAPVA